MGRKAIQLQGWLVSFCFCAALILITAACSGGAGTAPAAGSTTADALAEIQLLPPPPGIDAGLYEQLKAELLRAVAQNPKGMAAGAPVGAENRIADLAARYAGAGYRLSWSYRNRGDYDLNGEVNAADLTPLGLHFGATSASPDWELARLADGNGDGELNIGDITPIGQHFHARVAGYGIWGGNDAAGWNYLGQMELAAWEVVDGSRSFRYDFAQADFDYYYVAALDGQGAEGEPSNHAAAPRYWYSAGGGVQHSGLSRVIGPDAPQLAWMADLNPTLSGLTYGQPVLSADGTVYSAGEDGKLYAFNPDGSLRWTFAYGGEYESTPTIGPDGCVYVQGHRHATANQLLAVNPDGTERWRVDVADDVGHWAFTALGSPALSADGRVLCVNLVGVLHSVSPAGELQWTLDAGMNASGCSPALALDGTVYIAGDYVLAVNPDGSEKWRYAGSGGYARHLPVVGPNGTIYCGSDSGLVALLPDGSLDWRDTPPDAPECTSPALGQDGALYCLSNTTLICLNPQGSERWTRPELWDGGSRMFECLSIAGDGTMFITTGSALLALNSDGSERWRYEPGYWVVGQPALGPQRQLYLGGTTLRCVALQPGT